MDAQREGGGPDRAFLPPSWTLNINLKSLIFILFKDFIQNVYDIDKEKKAIHS